MKATGAILLLEPNKSVPDGHPCHLSSCLRVVFAAFVAGSLYFYLLLHLVLSDPTGTTTPGQNQTRLLQHLGNTPLLSAQITAHDTVNIP